MIYYTSITPKTAGAGRHKARTPAEEIYILNEELDSSLRCAKRFFSYLAVHKIYKEVHQSWQK